MTTTVTSAIELGKVCPKASLPEARSPGLYILKSNSYNIIPPLTFVRVSTGITIKFNAMGLIGRLSTLENALINLNLIVCVENVSKGLIQVMLYNTSASAEASIMPGDKIAELTFSYSISPLLYWRDDVHQKQERTQEHTQKHTQEHTEEQARMEQHTPRESIKRTNKSWTRTPNRCDKVANWRVKTNPHTSITTENPAEVWDPITSAPPPSTEDWDLEEAENPVRYAPFKLDVSNKKYGGWKNKPYMSQEKNKEECLTTNTKNTKSSTTKSSTINTINTKSSNTRRYIPLQRRNLVTVTTSDVTSTQNPSWIPLTSNPSWTTCSSIFSWPPNRNETITTTSKMDNF